MIRIILLTIFVVAILYFLKKNSNSNIYGKIIIVVVILVFLFLIATSGKLLIPQMLQVLKIGLPFITKFIGF